METPNGFWISRSIYFIYSKEKYHPPWAPKPICTWTEIFQIDWGWWGGRQAWYLELTCLPRRVPFPGRTHILIYGFSPVCWFIYLTKNHLGRKVVSPALTLIKMPATHIPGPGRSGVSETKQNSSLLCHSSWKEKAVKARNKISQGLRTLLLAME